MEKMNVPGYDSLADVLQRAYDQAANGKGKDRHAGDGVAFENQPMATINREQGSIDGYLYQARKKAIEARRLPHGRAQAELLGAINYLAGAVIALDTWAAGTLPQLVGDVPASIGTFECSGADVAADGIAVQAMVDCTIDQILRGPRMPIVLLDLPVHDPLPASLRSAAIRMGETDPHTATLMTAAANAIEGL